MRPVRLMTWNIHGFFGADGRSDKSRVLDVIRRIDPDILALQEVDGRVRFGREPFAFEALADSLGGHVAEARLFGRPGNEYGHILWSRWPFLVARVILLPGGHFEPRAAIAARIDTPNGPLRVVSAHFSLTPGARRGQADAVTGLTRGGEPAVAMGDFNEWLRSGPVHKWIAAALPVNLRPRSWPARRPIAAMDRIYASAGLALDPFTFDSVAAAAASDHLPVAAVLGRVVT